MGLEIMGNSFPPTPTPGDLIPVSKTQGQLIGKKTKPPPQILSQAFITLVFGGFIL